jgi:hypothetical protein
VRLFSEPMDRSPRESGRSTSLSADEAMPR